MSSTLLAQINNLNADELVKDILRGWVHVRETCEKEIRKFRFSEKTKKKLQLLAKELYDSYFGQESSQVRIRLDEGVLQDFFSVQIDQKDGHALFSYPFNILVAESLDANNLGRILQECPSQFNFEGFSKLFWRVKRNCLAKLSKVDLALLNQLCNGTETRSSISFPSASELRALGANFSDDTASRHYARLMRLTILQRFSVINYAKLGLVPLLKIYGQEEEPSEIELKYSTWVSPLSNVQSVRLLVIPEKSSFWAEYSASSMNIIQTRETGINIRLFDGKRWNLSGLKQFSADPLTTNMPPTPQWQMTFFLGDKFPFRQLDLRLLAELQYTPERSIKHLSSRLAVHRGHVSRRLKELQEAEVFQTYFRLHNVGLNERYQLLVMGKENELVPFYQLVCHLPQYYLTKAKACLYAIVRLPTESKSEFFNAWLRLKREIDEGYCGYITQDAKASPPALLGLWNDEGKNWFSEPTEG